MRATKLTATAAATAHSKATAFGALQQHDSDQAKSQKKMDDENNVFHLDL